ncbi:MAG: protein arginine kinase [Verrucomicrobia bacterium]|nr:protein arginine kinase [Verrucomicrobiota bacterium]
MNVHQFLAPLAQSCRRTGPHDRIVLSSRVRLARNLRGHSFPGHAKKPDRVRALELIRPTVEGLPEMAGAYSATMDELTPQDKLTLVERHLISREHAARSSGSGLVLNKEESLCVMINEEDHLRMQSLQTGLHVRKAWALIDQVDSTLEKRLDYAFSPDLGYLTACPTNLGTGIRVSAMLHLPGLVLDEQINAIINSVNKLGLAVRGLYGEGTEALGNIFQVSNQKTLGEAELEIVERVAKALDQVLTTELDARKRLLQRKPKALFNYIGRAYGILTNSHIITSKEAMNQLSLLRLGVDLNLFPEIPRSLLEEMFILIQQAHLQQHCGEKLEPEKRDLIRADILRERLQAAPRPKTTDARCLE